MENRKVKDLMVPLAEYATVSQEATLYEAVLALEEAQHKFRKRLYKHRAILVYDQDGKIVGKVSQNDVIRGLEPRYKDIGDISKIPHSGLAPAFIKSMMATHGLWQRPLEEICRNAARKKVRDFMYTPAQGELVEEEATLDEAVHQLVVGYHQSLLVTRGERVVGILRLTDVFTEICNIIKASEI